MYRLLIAAALSVRAIQGLAQTSRADTLRVALLIPAWATRADSQLASGVVQGLSDAARAASLAGGAISVLRVATPPGDALALTIRSLRARGVSALIARDVGGLATRGFGGGGALTEAWCNVAEAGATAVGMLFVDAGCASVESLSSCNALTIRVWPGAKDRAEALSHVSPDESARARVVAWDSTLQRHGAEQLNRRFRASAGRTMTSEAWSGWIAMKVLWEASQRAHSTDPTTLARTLLDPATQFDGSKSRLLAFRARDHRLDQPLYVIFERKGRRTLVDVSDASSVRPASRVQPSGGALGACQS